MVTNADIARVYSNWGRRPWLYAAQDWLTFLGRHKRIRRKAVESARLAPGQRVLEIGCGTGRNLEHIVRDVGPTGKVVGFDFSPEMLSASGDLCRDRGWQNVDLVQGDAAVLDVGNQEFDAVIMVLALSAIPEHRRALRRAWEVLRPRGRLAVCDARLFLGPLATLNPLVRALYTRVACWNPDRDLVADIEEVFDTIAIERFNAGTFFIASAEKLPRDSERDAV